MSPLPFLWVSRFFVFRFFMRGAPAVICKYGRPAMWSRKCFARDAGEGSLARDGCPASPGRGFLSRTGPIGTPATRVKP